MSIVRFILLLGKMKVQIELSKDVDYPSKKLGKYIWNLEESNNHVTGFCDSIGECFEEIIRHEVK